MSKIKEINIHSQTQTKRVFVGKLWREGKKYFFEYGKSYKKLRNDLPLGPELPLWKGIVSSNTLFPSFSDRIPSKNNPAYKDYCHEWDVSENEKDVFILLTTIGRRGPSTFMFEPVFKNEYEAPQLKNFRTRLGLTQSEFEALFNISHMTLSRLETGKSKNDFYLRYFELFDKVPQALTWMLKKRGQFLHDEKRTRLLKMPHQTGKVPLNNLLF